jgi:hypothetical protein
MMQRGSATTVGQRSGLFKGRLSPNGDRQIKVLFYGFMANVSVSREPHSHEMGLMEIHFNSGFRKDRPLVHQIFQYLLLQDLMLSASSAIVQEINEMKEAGLASLAFFYSDLNDDRQRNRRQLLSSLLVQLSDQSDAYYDVLFKLYTAHNYGSQDASDDALIQCLKSMLGLGGQAPVYVVIDAIDECPNTTSVTSPSDDVLGLVEELVQLQVSHLRLCVTSRPEADIHPVFDSLTFRSISLHNEHGQMQDIANYIRFVVNTDPKMRRWRPADKELVIEVLTTKADGM